MIMLASIGRRLMVGLRALDPSIGVRVPAPELTSAEVEDVKERYSAKRYVMHLKAAMAGDHRGRREWSRYIQALEPDAYNAFFYDVDALIDAGELVYVPTPEERAEIQQRVLDNIDHWREEASRIGKDWGIVPEAMHRLLNGEDVPDEELIAIDDEEVDAWLEEEEHGEEEEQGQEG